MSTNEQASGTRKKVYIKTHGCQMNEYDSSRMLDLLRETQGADLVETPEEADILLLNTCSNVKKPRKKSFTNWAAGAA